jgi:tetratricopeptide (TPR) repeat protein
MNHLAAAWDLLRHDFAMQLALAADAWVFGLEALFVGLLATAWLVILGASRGTGAPVARDADPLDLAAHGAARWVPVLLLAPLLAGLGLVLPAIGFLAFLMPSLRTRERVLAVALALFAIATPVAGLGFARLEQALRTDGAPFHGIFEVEHAPYDAARQSHLQQTSAAAPHDGFAAFALGWHSRRGSQLAEAERAYRIARAAWPREASVRVDLGNVLALAGREDDALRRYREASSLDPREAAAHFNTSQLLLRRFDYDAARRELAMASALDFERVRRLQARTGTDGALTLMDEWPRPALFWNALTTTPVDPVASDPATHDARASRSARLAVLGGRRRGDDGRAHARAPPEPATAAASLSELRRDDVPPLRASTPRSDPVPRVRSHRTRCGIPPVRAAPTHATPP